MNESDRLGWVERHSTLHTEVQILYVVDGYEVSVEHDSGRRLHGPWHGATLGDAIDAAIVAMQGRPLMHDSGFT